MTVTCEPSGTAWNETDSVQIMPAKPWYVRLWRVMFPLRGVPLPSSAWDTTRHGIRVTCRPTIALGNTVRDRISGFEGVVVCISNWLNGCQRVTLAPQNLCDGKLVSSETFDAEQLQVVEAERSFEASAKGGPSIAPQRNVDPV